MFDDIHQVRWAERPAPGCIELIPLGDKQDHYFGDECWCGTKVKHMVCGACRSSVVLFVHMPQDDAQAQLIVDVVIAQVVRVIEGSRRNG